MLRPSEKICHRDLIYNYATSHEIIALPSYECFAMNFAPTNFSQGTHIICHQPGNIEIRWNKKAFPNIKPLGSYHHVHDYLDRWVYLNLKNPLQFSAFEIWKRWSPSRFARGKRNAPLLSKTRPLSLALTGLKGWVEAESRPCVC